MVQLKDFLIRNIQIYQKNKISKSVKLSYCNGRKIGECKSKYFNTKYGKLQGSFEVAYIQQLLNKNIQLPNIHPKGIKTPLGNYFPDFEYTDRYVEIKSQYTYDISAGKFKSIKGKTNHTQLKKIEWIKTNIKNVSIIIMDKKEAWSLFKQAILQDWIFDNVKIKYNKYEILLD